MYVNNDLKNGQKNLQGIIETFLTKERLRDQKGSTARNRHLGVLKEVLMIIFVF